MATALSTYAYINAKLRGRIGKLLDEESFRRIASARSFPEAMAMLAGTPYEAAVEAYTRTGDVKMSELELVRTEWALLASLDHAVPDAVRPFTDAVLRRFEVASVKQALRLWFEHAVRGRPIDEKVAYLVRDERVHDAPVDACINASGADDVVAALAGRPYADELAGPLGRVEQSGSLFEVEVALDRWYYRRLVEEARALGGRDAPIALRLLGLQIDMLNVNWIVRMHRAYGSEHGDLLEAVLPGGTLIGPADARAAYRADRPIDELLGVLGGRHAIVASQRSDEGTGGPRRLVLLEELLREVLFSEVHRTLGGYPFTIGTVLAYVLLVGNEVRLLISVLNAKYYDLPPDRIEDLL
ncbi:MAG: V-type ATPase subunit [Spirochaetota bacterium]